MHNEDKIYCIFNLNAPSSHFVVICDADTGNVYQADFICSKEEYLSSYVGSDDYAVVHPLKNYIYFAYAKGELNSGFNDRLNRFSPEQQARIIAAKSFWEKDPEKCYDEIVKKSNFFKLFLWLPEKAKEKYKELIVESPNDMADQSEAVLGMATSRPPSLSGLHALRLASGVTRNRILRLAIARQIRRGQIKP